MRGPSFPAMNPFPFGNLCFVEHQVVPAVKFTKTCLLVSTLTFAPGRTMQFTPAPPERLKLALPTPLATVLQALSGKEPS